MLCINTIDITARQALLVRLCANIPARGRSHSITKAITPPMIITVKQHNAKKCVIFPIMRLSSKMILTIKLYIKINTHQMSASKCDSPFSCTCSVKDSLQLQAVYFDWHFSFLGNAQHDSKFKQATSIEGSEVRSSTTLLDRNYISSLQKKKKKNLLPHMLCNGQCELFIKWIYDYFLVPVHICTFLILLFLY